MGDYDYYTMKIPLKLKEFFEKYLKKHPELGFTKVSQFTQHILQEEALKIIKKDKDFEDILKT